MNTTLEIIREAVNLSIRDWAHAGLLTILGILASWGISYFLWSVVYEPTYRHQIDKNMAEFCSGFFGAVAVAMLVGAAIFL